MHGCFPNSSATRFRRALIGHYVQGDTQKVSEFYRPVLRLDGSPLELDIIVGGACGAGNSNDGIPEIAMSGQERIVRKHE